MKRDREEPMVVAVDVAAHCRRNIRATLRHLAKAVGVVTLTTEPGTMAALLHVPNMEHRGWWVGISIHIHIRHFINVDVDRILYELHNAAGHLVKVEGG